MTAYTDNTDYSGNYQNATDPDEITYHRDGPGDAHPAINVKIWAIPGGQSAVDAALGGFADDDASMAWDNVVESFWDGADLIAVNHGYTGVESEGRSGGWLVPLYDLSDPHEIRYPDMADPSERARFAAFRADILDMLADVPAMLHAEAAALAAMGEEDDSADTYGRSEWAQARLAADDERERQEIDIRLDEADRIAADNKRRGR